MCATSGADMSDEEKPPAEQALQFDRLVTDGPSSLAQSTPSTNCTMCGNSFQAEYYSVNGHTACGACRHAIEAATETPREAGPFILAALTAYILSGAKIWFAIAQLTGFLNLFNLIPVWQLDGSRGMHVLARSERWILVAAIVAALMLT